MSTAEQALSTTVIDRGVLPTTEVIARVRRVQEIMKALMKEGVHYGTIPGTPKPTLYKAGAELLLMTFRVAADPANIDDLSTQDEVRYRITIRGTNQVTGEVVGAMTGECSSSETKYRWVKPVCDEEWNETDPAMRREKWMKGSPPYKVKQIRSSPADVANTILSMAAKRGLIAMTRVALGVSDVFAQNLEDLTEELRDSLLADEGTTKAEPPKQPQRRSETGNGTAKAAKPIPEHAKVVVGVIAKTYDDKKPYAVLLQGSTTRYTTFDDAVWGDVKVFAGTSHKVRLAYTETTKDGRTYCNVAGISIADEPASQRRAPAQEPPPMTADDIPFDREPGSDG